MGFVLIVEPEEVNAARIHTILESVDKDFEYKLVDSADKAIEVIENRKPDVFIADMQMGVVSGTEFFSMVEMMVPEAVRIVMTDGNNIEDTIAFVNECKTFKIIIKPCRVADDLFTPIHAAFQYKKQQEHIAQDLEIANAGRNMTLQNYEKAENTWKDKLIRYQRVQNIYINIINYNVELAGFEPKVLERTKRWYQWMMEEYVHLVLCGTGDYEQTVKMLMGTCHEPKYGCTFQMRKKTEFKIAPERMNEIAYILRLATGVGKDLLNVYQISVLIEESEKAYILRIRYQLEKDENGELGARAYRVRNKELRSALLRATELGIESFGYKAAVIKKEQEDILNIAIPH